MRIGVTGHQKRDGIDWTWTCSRIEEALDRFPDATEGLTALSTGADTVFAQICLARGLAVTAVVPLDGYERFFRGSALETYETLLRSSTAIHLLGDGEEDAAFFAAGRYVVDHADALIAVWDEQPAAGLGGTADVVAHARATGRMLYLINPLTRTITFPH